MRYSRSALSALIDTGEAAKTIDPTCVDWATSAFVVDPLMMQRNAQKKTPPAKMQTTRSIFQRFLFRFIKNNTQPKPHSVFGSR